MNQPTSDAAEILEQEFGDDPDYREALAQERVKSQAAQAISQAPRNQPSPVWKTASMTGTRRQCWSASPPCISD